MRSEVRRQMPQPTDRPKAKLPDDEIDAALRQPDETETLEMIMSRLVSESYNADRIIAMARLSYVRCLLTLTGASASKSDSLIPRARELTAETVSGVLKLPVTAAQIAVIIGSEDDDKPQEPTPTPNRAKM